MFQLISDGSCDLSPEQQNTAGIAVVPFYVSLDDHLYQKEAVEISTPDFYDYCIRHPECTPKTSMPSIRDYIEIFRRYLEQGTDILCYCITKTFSGSLNSALVAKDQLQGEYPDRQIRVVDSTLATGLQGALLMELSHFAKEGHSLQETFERGEAIKKNAALFFSLKDLTYLARGGRIGTLTDLAVRNLNLRPLLGFQNGEISPLGICFGRDNSYTRLTEIARKTILERKLNLTDYTFGIGWGHSKAEIEPFIRQIHDLFQELFGEVPAFLPIQLGATIGVHTGPYPVGFGFIEKA